MILADILRYIDDRGVFPRLNNNPTPFLLLDGHGSRLEVPFLSYINDPTHKWIVCIGCPNGTSLWQVGDSSEQNGCYKIYCAEHKRKLTSKRIEMGINRLNLVRTDIIPIVNAAWKKSFAKTNSNLKAIRDRGWGPLNKVLLHHPEIRSSKPPSPSDIPPTLSNEDSPIASPSSEDPLSPIPRPLMNEGVIDVDDINFNEGFAGDVIQTILRRAQRDHKTLRNLRQSKKLGTDFTSSMKSSSKWTAGVIFDKGKCYLDHEVLQLAKDAKEKKQSKFWEQVVSACDMYNKLKCEYEKAIEKLAKIDTHNNLPIRILSPLCKWKRRKGDKNMPTLRSKLMERWNETKDRSDISLDEYLKTFTSIYQTYQKANQGKTLTIDMISSWMAEHHDVGIDGATPIVHAPTATDDDDGEVAVAV